MNLIQFYSLGVLKAIKTVWTTLNSRASMEIILRTFYDFLWLQADSCALNMSLGLLMPLRAIQHVILMREHLLLGLLNRRLLVGLEDFAEHDKLFFQGISTIHNNFYRIFEAPEGKIS